MNELRRDSDEIFSGINVIILNKNRTDTERILDPVHSKRLIEFSVLSTAYRSNINIGTSLSLSVKWDKL